MPDYPFRARFAGYCLLCDEKIIENEMVIYDEEGNVVHHKCIVARDEDE